MRYVGAIYAQLFGEVPQDVAAFLDTTVPTVYVALTSSVRTSVSGVREAGGSAGPSIGRLHGP